MMREIKFRAWDKKNNRIVRNATPSFFWQKEGTLMQFTGLKDKNGKEIYEGDILKYGNEEEYPKTTFSLVFWCEFRAKFMDKKKFISGGGASGELNSWDNYLDEIKDLDFCEVIGNKFENPELLK